MREMILGVIAVGLVAGVMLGRHSERARRSLKDVGTAKTNLGKTKTTLRTELRRAVIVGLVVALVVISLVSVALDDRSAP